MIHDLCLPVSLGVIGRAMAKRGTTQLKELLPECAQEYRVSIGNNGTGKAMEFNHYINKQFRYFCVCKLNWERSKVS